MFSLSLKSPFQNRYYGFALFAFPVLFIFHVTYGSKDEATPALNLKIPSKLS